MWVTIGSEVFVSRWQGLNLSWDTLNLIESLYLFEFTPPQKHSSLSFLFVQKADSDDSGNEEPDAAADFYTKKDKRVNVIKSHSHKMDKLTERISSLTIARDSDKECIPEGLVDSLPPEGMWEKIESFVL